LADEIIRSGSFDLCWENYLEDIFPMEPEDFSNEGESDFIINFIETKEKEKAFYWYPKRKIGYMPDEKAEYSTIIREFTSQVVRSNWFIRGALCSPCYPGQVDVDSPGEFLAYSFPPDVIGEDVKNYKIFKEGREK
jgi:hypothetical protein